MGPVKLITDTDALSYETLLLRKLLRNFADNLQLWKVTGRYFRFYETPIKTSLKREISIGPQMRRFGFINRFKQGLETCRQANLCQSVHSNFNRVRATSMTQRRVENSLDTFAHFRLYLLN